MNKETLEYPTYPGNHIYVYEYDDEDYWRVNEGLLLGCPMVRNADDTWFLRDVRVPVVFRLDRDDIRFRALKHRKHSRPDTDCWVFAHEFELIAGEVNRSSSELADPSSMFKWAFDDIEEIRESRTLLKEVASED